MNKKVVLAVFLSVFLFSTMHGILFVGSQIIAPAKAANPYLRIAIDVTRLYSYSPTFSHVMNALEAEGYTVDVWWDGNITANRLDGYRVLVICWPQAAYTDSEVTAILDFISSGHGLLFLGEYGKTWHMYSGGVYPTGAEPIIDPLGVSINNNLLYDPTDYVVHTTWPKIDTFPIMHPATHGIGIYMPAGTATLVVNSSGTTIATGDNDTYAVDPDGTDPEGDLCMHAPVMAASTYGMGKAIVAGDHNWIGDQWSIRHDNIRLFVNIVNWLCLPSYTPAIHSSPTGVTFTVDGASFTTPWSGTYIENTSVSLVLPLTHTVGDARYYWNQWSDGNTSRSRTVTINTNITLTAHYTGPYYQLTVTSSPITGIPFTINGNPKTTPYTEWLPEGSYTLEMPENHNGNVWSHWLEDGDINRIKTILPQGTTWTAVYVPRPVGGEATPINIPMNKPETPALWMSLTTILLSLVVTVGYVEKRKRDTKRYV